MIAGLILAGFSLSAVAQYPNNPSDNSLGVMPMSPVSASSMPRYGTNYGIVPKPPFAPGTTTRPAGWVGGTASEAAPNDNPPPQNPQPPAQQQCYAPAGPQGSPLNYPSTEPNAFAPLINRPLDSPTNPPAGQFGGLNPNPNPAPNEMLNLSGAPQLTPGTVILARVGSEAIFASEITPPVDRYLAEIKAKMSPEEVELHLAEFEMQRDLLIKQSLKSHIESRLISQDFKRDIPAEQIVGVNKQLGNMFEKTELPKLLKRENATTVKELEQKLKSFGSSLAQEKDAFNEKALVSECMRRQIKPDEMPTVTQMTHYYDTHKADFTTAAKARWEELTVSKAKYAGKDQALEAIAQMGNRVLIAGEPFAEVAKQSSDGFTAADGGLRAWASKGSLADKEIDAALFGPSLPVGQLSQIIETPQDYNIIRIIERVERKTEEFTDIQDKIRKKIMDERTDRQIREYLERLEKRTPIWTIYDGTGGNLSLAERLNEKQTAVR